MKKTTVFLSFILIAFFITGVTPLFSQELPRKGRFYKDNPGKWHRMINENRKNRIDKLSEKLNLTQQQKEQISKIIEQGWDEIEKEMEKHREKVIQIRKKTDDEIEKLLTSEQKEKFKEMKTKAKEKIRDKKRKEK